MDIRIGTYRLHGEAWNEKVSGPQISWARDVQIQKHFRALYPKLRDGENEVASISFSVARAHPDYRAALIYLLDHGKNVPRTGTVFMEETTDDGTVKRRWENAKMVNFTARRIGVTTIHEYLILGTEVK